MTTQRYTSKTLGSRYMVESGRSTGHFVADCESAEMAERIADALNAQELAEQPAGELLPCPFCGRQPSRPAPNRRHSEAYELTCECGASFGDDQTDPAEIDAAWNRRAASAVAAPTHGGVGIGGPGSTGAPPAAASDPMAPAGRFWGNALAAVVAERDLRQAQALREALDPLVQQCGVLDALDVCLDSPPVPVAAAKAHVATIRGELMAALDAAPAPVEPAPPAGLVEAVKDADALLERISAFLFKPGVHNHESQTLRSDYHHWRQSHRVESLLAGADQPPATDPFAGIDLSRPDGWRDVAAKVMCFGTLGAWVYSLISQLCAAGEKLSGADQPGEDAPRGERHGREGE